MKLIKKINKKLSTYKSKFSGTYIALYGELVVARNEYLRENFWMPKGIQWTIDSGDMDDLGFLTLTPTYDRMNRDFVKWLDFYYEFEFDWDEDSHYEDYFSLGGGVLLDTWNGPNGERTRMLTIETEDNLFKFFDKYNPKINLAESNLTFFYGEDLLAEAIIRNNLTLVDYDETSKEASTEA